MDRYDNRKYVIIPLSKVEDINYDEIVEKSAQSLRISQDGEYTIVKFDSDITPSFLDGLTQYSHTEIIAIVHDTSGIWHIDDDESSTWRNTVTEVIDAITWSKYNPFNWFS